MEKSIIEKLKENRKEHVQMLDAETQRKYDKVSKKEGKYDLNLYDRIAIERERGRW